MKKKLNTHIFSVHILKPSVGKLKYLAPPTFFTKTLLEQTTFIW